MPVSPNVLERLLLGRLQQAPASILDLFGAASLRAVSLGREYGVFEALERDPATPVTLADRLGLDARGVDALLAFLEQSGYVVERREGRYENTALTRRWILREADGSLGAWLVFWDQQVLPFWTEQMGVALENGRPDRTFYEWLDDRKQGWEQTQAAFEETAEEVVAEVDLQDGPAPLLDLGGGHGLYSVRFCQSNPELEATVFDDPAALAAARETIAETGLDDRMGVCGGDFLTDDVAGGYDVVLLFNVFHGGEDYGPLFDRVHDALAPGGRLVIMDQFDEAGRLNVQPAMLRLLDLAYFGMLGGGLPDETAVREQLAAARFGEVECVNLRSVRGISLLIATRG